MYIYDIHREMIKIDARFETFNVYFQVLAASRVYINSILLANIQLHKYNVMFYQMYFTNYSPYHNC